MQSIVTIALVSLLTLSATEVVADKVDVELVGVSILGRNHRAIVEVDGATHSVQQGDQIAGYRVDEITARSVRLKDQESQELLLELKTRTAIPKLEESRDERQQVERADPQQPYENPKVLYTPPPPVKIGEGVYRGNPVFVDEADVPPGYKRVRSFLGDYIVKE
ncbi:MAG: hypothetical protein HN842_05695 [Gammaproteobacteria bacterium]|jgi:hypothetical protein|nr:hypothetical protein [Gammaproteobacteria bacterium]MBT7307690.1 hypothetical protein [Gammaproteobacteria bacterium]